MIKPTPLASRTSAIAPLGEPEGVFALTDSEVAMLIQHSVSGLARHLDLAPRTLRRVCAEKGVSLRAFRALLVIAGARTLLQANFPVKDVAHRLGFSSSQTLARFIRRECGTTARELKAKHRNDRSTVNAEPEE